MYMSNQVRVRFAPSPTGPLHMGGVRTALYNYLFARKNGGEFVLRIEDTDQSRYIKGAEDYILNSLDWCGLKFNEGPHLNGKYGPYRQSERKEIYKSHITKLIESGHAYYAFDSEKELDQMRTNLKKAGVQSPQYNQITRQNMKNSLTLNGEEVKNRLMNNEAYVVRINMPRNQEIKFKDKIRGWVSFNTNNLDDKVLFKSDGMPTYHLANVIDDHLMKISHVIRGEEWLPSAPLHIFLYQCFGWEKDMPEFAHLPLILNPEGDGKLSKRDGDRLGFPIFPILWNNIENHTSTEGYKEKGFLKEAFVNMLVFLGWNPGNTKEIYSLEELVDDFSLERVGKSGSRYNFEKTKWFNQQHIRLKSAKQILKNIKFPENKNEDYLLKVVDLVKERCVFYKDFINESTYLFSPPEIYEKEAVQKKWSIESVGHLLSIKTKLSLCDDFSKENLETIFKNYLKSSNIGFGKAMPGLRISITGRMQGPSMFSIMNLLGKDEVLSRIEKAIKKLGNGNNNS